MYVSTCPNCFIEFGIPDAMERAKRNDHTSFYCPNGHSLSWQQSSPEEKLRLERDRLKQQLSQKDDEIRAEQDRAAAERARAAKAEMATKRLRKRIDAGLCPCCNRSFENLARHMKTQHGDKVVPLKKAIAS